MTFGSFIEPNTDLAESESPAKDLGIKIYSGYQAIKDSDRFRGKNRIFDDILEKSKSSDLVYEDQCSSQYYFDLVKTLRDFNGEFDRVVEVGVFMGGASAVLAGCMEPFGFGLDMVDINANYLHFAYERIRRLYPETAHKIRLFHGDLPSYVREVILKENARSIVHHDAGHSFNVVVKDMAALSFVKEKLFAIIAQDTHLRGTISNMNFVDMALYAVFGLDLSYAPIGFSYSPLDSRTAPNMYGGNYFMPNEPEGFVLPMNQNEFRYPHPCLLYTS
ncbi:MAG TPA: hypothetical protein DEV96_07545, partial [Rhodospirillum rubrum]|nr:hypothetical protein [Rhodospirillum rubrum]